MSIKSKMFGQAQPKLTKSEKILAKLEKLNKKDDKVLDNQVKEFMDDTKKYEAFVQGFEHWYMKNSKRYMRYMSNYGREIITETEFKVAFRDLRPPFSDVQIHIIYLWLDPKRTGHVEYAALFEALYRALSKRYIQQDEVNAMDLEDPSKWILMTFKSPTYEPLELPTSFNHLVHLGYTGTMLRELILFRVPLLNSRVLIIFTDPARYTETVVHCNQKLYEFSYKGGPKHAPEEATIYYEFSVGYIDCPLLLLGNTTVDKSIARYNDFTLVEEPSNSKKEDKN